MYVRVHFWQMSDVVRRLIVDGRPRIGLTPRSYSKGILSAILSWDSESYNRETRVESVNVSRLKSVRT